MKKILSLIILLVAATGLQAQTSGAVVTTVPANFTALDQVKIIVDVSNVGNLAGKEPLYIWTWDPGDPAPGNGAWDNSNEARKMTKEGPNVWSWTITPATYYGVAPGTITQIQFLVKAKNANGDLKTDDIKLAVAPLVYTPTDFRTFPSTVSQNDLISVYLDQNLATDLTTQRMTPTNAEVKLFDASNAQVGSTKTYAVSALGNKTFRFRLFPKGEFTIPAGVKVNRITVTYTGTILNTSGAPVSASSKEFQFLLDDLK